MSVFKLCLKTLSLLVTGTAVQASLTSPNPPAVSCGPRSIFERFIQSITLFSKCFVWVGIAVEIVGSAMAFTGCSVVPVGYDFVISRNIRGSADVDSLPWTTSNLALIGTLTTVVAAALRIWCFRTLGRLFTFEISIRPDHELVTVGPYAWARHPSYTGIYLTLFGATAVLFAPGTWIMQRCISNEFGIFFLVFWLVKCAFVFRGTNTRLRIEDDMLRRTFGERWDQYAKTVPAVFFPGII